MGTFQQSRGTVRFDVFEVDRQAGELRKQDVKVALQEQPFQILQMLLEHPGKVVTRMSCRRGSGRPTRLLISSKVFTTHQASAPGTWRFARNATVHRDSAQERLSFHRLH